MDIECRNTHILSSNIHIECSMISIIKEFNESLIYRKIFQKKKITLQVFNDELTSLDCYPFLEGY